MQTSPKPNSLNRYTADILTVSLGAFAIVVFLSVAFIWFDATNLPSNGSAPGVIGHGLNNRGEIDRDRRDSSEDLVATADPVLSTTPFQFASRPSASLSTANLSAVISPDNITWRHTNEGWRDISMAVKPPPSHKPWLEGVHPAVWTAMLLLSSLLLLIMASSDADIKKLLGRKSVPKQNREKLDA